MIIGSDHSHWDWTNQDNGYVPIDFTRSRAVFVFLKACDGARDTPYYQETITLARQAGKLAAPYVWCHGRNWYDPRKQGEFWYSRLAQEPLIAIDFENFKDSIPNYDDLYNAVNRMLELGYKGKFILYTSWAYWLSYGTSAEIWNRLFAGIWLSDPDDDPPVAPFWASASEKARKAPTPFVDVLIHQYSFSGDSADYGVTVKKAVDENKTAISQAELETLFGGTYVPPEPGGNDMYQGTVLVNLNYRKTPGGVLIGTMPAGTKVEADRTENKYWHLTKIGATVQTSDAWAFEGDNNGYIRLDAVIEPPVNEKTVTVTVQDGELSGSAVITLK